MESDVRWRMIQERIPLRACRRSNGNSGVRLDRTQRVEYSRCLYQGPLGPRVVDFQKSNLHVVNYSMPVHATMPLNELKAHLFTLPEHPDWIPYRTSYYQENWGFCLSHNQMLASRRETMKCGSTPRWKRDA